MIVVAADDRTRTVLPPQVSEAGGAAPRGPLFDQEPTFVPGEMVAGRYRVERFIAFGGMGEVYEAEDTELKSRVALKTLRPDLAEDARILERFKREILLARRITHVNVCRIFDLGVHHGTRDVTSFTMELLGGDTLAQRLREKGKMAPAEALPLVRQMIAALEAAHREGIIHRDFKSANVMLVGGDPSGSAGRGDGEGSQPPPWKTRVVVTDFGLARGTAGDPFATNVTADRLAMMGSPAYMAPEQVEGEETTVASDVYSLGIVVYEMVTGRVPFEGDSAMSVAVKRLKELPPPPRRFAPDLDARWEDAILRCLEREPARRFPGVGAFRDALEAPPPRRRRPGLAPGLGGAAAGARFGRVAWGGQHRDGARDPPGGGAARIQERDRARGRRLGGHRTCGDDDDRARRRRRPAAGRGGERGPDEARPQARGRGQLRAGHAGQD